MLHPSPSAARSGPLLTATRGAARDDGELMRRVVAGDAGALGAIYDLHARAAYALAFRMLHDRAASEDVVQEAFMSLWRGRHSYRPERGGLGTWLLTITRNRAVDAIRRGRAHVHAELDAGPEQEAPDRTDEEVLRRLEAAGIGVALRSLPETQREALELSYFGGFTHSEIAARLGLPLGTVKSRMRLALHKLAAHVDPPAAPVAHA